jgi:hypothetical protein
MPDDYLKFLAALYRLDEEGWERHTNPWSVWTRVATWPVLMLVLWSFHWFGEWSLLPLGVTIGWLLLNPHAFPAPASTKSWASRGVLGERVYLMRELHPIPLEHVNAVTVIGVGSGVGFLFLVAGLLTREPAAFLAGGVAVFLCKLWLVDRMVWLFDEMKEQVPEYAAWLR